MIKIKALNEDVSASEEECEEPENGLLTSEAQEEHLHSLYCQALKLIDSDKEQAKTEFISLLDALDELDEAPGINNIKNLKYLSLKNLGLISPKNLDYFLDALSIDGGDVTLWIETGRRALNEFINLPLARACFEEAAKISSCNWLVVDTLIGLYFVLNDYVNCLELCTKALHKDQHYFKARLLISEILKRSPPLVSELPKNLHFLINWKPSGKDLERSQRILLEFKNLKERRKRKFILDETNQYEKRKKFSLNLDSSVVGSLQSLGTTLKNIFNELEKENCPRSTIITIDLETGSDEAPSTDDNISDEYSEKDKHVNKSEKRGSFPFEFIDKRRSTRVQRIHNKTSDACEFSSDNIYEKVLSMIPSSILTHQVQIKKPEIEAPKYNDAQVENSILSRFMAKQKDSKSNGKRIDQLIADFLFGIAEQAISIKLPSVFIELYKIHRQTYDLPCPLSCQLDNDITSEEIKLILTANEMEFRQSEVIFLTQMLPILRNDLTPSEYDQFYVRLLTLRGIKENQVDYLLVANEKIVFNNIKLIQASNQVIYNSSSLKSMINTLNENNLDKLLSEQRHEELIELLASKSDFSESEENYLCQAIESSQSWHRGIEIISGSKKLTDQLLKLLRTCLKHGSNFAIGGDLVTRLLKLGTEQYNALAWTCILHIFISELNRGVDEKKIVCLIVTVHQYLGRAGTCTQANGEFLLLALDFAINQCSRTKDDLILQCFACLYNHPPPRPGCTFLQAHPSVPQIPLQWEHVDIIYNYFMPEILPEFDSVKRDSIDSDTEILLCRIVALIPDHLNPEKDAKSINEYLENGKPMNRELNIPKHQVTQHLFYFLADYYFKNQEFLKAKNFYVLDLALNHDRFDSWAACALSITHLIEQYFSNGEDIFYKSTDKVIRLVESAFRCYVEALHIEPNNCKIWIEYGNLAYNVASYISRVKKRISSSPSDKEKLVKQKKKMLHRARICFKSANNVADAEEVWLHYYFLGKIAERNNILQALKYYELSDLHLALSGATYPTKISYHNSTRLSIEALEVHYRIHACVLKYIRRHSGRIPAKTLSQIKIHLLRALRSPFAKQAQVSNSTSDHDYISNEIRVNTVNHQILNDVKEVVSDLVSLVDEGVLDGDERRLKPKIMEMCLEAMNRCLQRFPNHYKSLYRMAYHFFSLKDFIAARVVLLGRFTASSGTQSLLKKPESLLDLNNQEKPEPILGLFADHKNNNLFNGIWRIPTDDIDRPGSFSTHMFRSTQLLIKISWALSDLYRLLSIATQLSKTPEVGKKYLRDIDREYLGKDALRRCFSILKNRIEEVRQNRNQLDQIRNDIRKVSERLIKYPIYQKDTMSFMGECEQLLLSVQLSH